jgi:hypothetical protein
MSRFTKFPLKWWCDPIPVDKVFLQSCKLATMQFVVCKPVGTLLAIILEASGGYAEVLN